MNKVYLIGNLGGDPIKSTFENGVKCSFALATSESYKVEGEWKSTSTWHNIVSWDKFLVEKLQSLKKGDRVFCEGKIGTGTYEVEGVKKHFINIIVQKIYKLERQEVSQ